MIAGTDADAMVEVLLVHRYQPGGFCMDFKECGFRIRELLSAPQERKAFAQHQVDMMIKDLT